VFIFILQVVGFVEQGSRNSALRIKSIFVTPMNKINVVAVELNEI